MNFGKPPYYSEKNPFPPIVLERFLPPYPNGSLTEMLKFNGIHNGWVLDPIGNQPISAIELAQSGYKVFVACNNPVLGKLLQVMCAAHPFSLYQSAIAEFGALRRGEDRLEIQIKNLYISHCPECDSTETEVRYLWKKNQTNPFGKEINCSNCGFTNITKIPEEELINLSKIGNVKLHRTRVLQRVIPGSVDIPIAVMDVVDSYLPRSLAVISSLINKLDSFNVSQVKRDIIDALLINVFDFGNMLRGISSSRSRPKQITIPAEFYEYNLWKILEEGISKLRVVEKPISFTFYPELPPDSGGICFLPARINSIKEINKLPSFQAITTVLPRPNQALWTYNAVWSGWLWGQEEAKKLKGALERRRYDWIWHSQAIQTVFNFSSKFNIPFLAIAPELSNSYILAYLSAASSSGFQLSAAAYHAEQKSGQFYWVPISSTPIIEEPLLEYDIIKKYLEQKCESADYQELFSIYLISKFNYQRIANQNQNFDNTLFIQTQKIFENTLTDDRLFYQVDEDQLENAEFWLRHQPDKYFPHSDQIEGLFIRFVQKNPLFQFEYLMYQINQNLPGLLPVSHAFLQRLVSSYCEALSEGNNSYKLKIQEESQARKTDFQQISKLVNRIGKDLGYSVLDENPCKWLSDGGVRQYKFFITASSIMSQFISKFENENFESVIILPGSRAELLSYKLKNDPIYHQNFKRIHFVKYRHLRLISENPSLNVETWAQILDSDPAVWQEVNQPVLF